MFSFPEASCRRGQPAGDWPGVAPTDKTGRELTRLSETLSSCASPDRRVKIEVWGFASSSEVKNPSACGVVATSDAANTLIAEQRAKNVATLIGTLIGKRASADVDVTYHRWSGSFEDMVSNRRFLDRLVPNHYIEARGAFNRRVEIRILDAGGCETREAVEK
jgi:hypothetical protein